jgi:hypothetical protein
MFCCRCQYLRLLPHPLEWVQKLTVFKGTRPASSFMAWNVCRHCRTFRYMINDGSHHWKAAEQRTNWNWSCVTPTGAWNIRQSVRLRGLLPHPLECVQRNNRQHICSGTDVNRDCEAADQRTNLSWLWRSRGRMGHSPVFSPQWLAPASALMCTNKW